MGTKRFTFSLLCRIQGSGIDWNVAAKPYRDTIMQFLEDNYLPDLQENIVAEHYIDPLAL